MEAITRLIFLKLQVNLTVRLLSSERTLMIFQSSRAAPGGVIAVRVTWTRPSVFTNVPFFSVYAAAGRITSALEAPASPLCPM